MLPKKKIEGLVEYWITTSKKDLADMQSLYRDKRYSACLFFGHLVLEKILKALVVQETSDFAPRIHNLPRLAELAKLELDSKELNVLIEADRFNMETRYPDEQLVFYKKCTKVYTDQFFNPIISLHQKLCHKIK